MWQDIDKLFEALSKSKFRSSFSLGVKELNYLKERSLDDIKAHAFQIISKRIAPAAPANDGRQTPMKNHPVFIAQHATATCCRSCLKKWHNIPQNIQLNNGQIVYVVDIIMQWLNFQKAYFEKVS